MGAAGSRRAWPELSTQLQECTVAANLEVAPGHALVTFESDLAAEAEPGQFVQVSLDGVVGAFLPRPFSFHRTASDQFQLLLRSVGPGTSAIAAARPGQRLRVLGPLGHGFELRRCFATDRPITLVGGGVGVPPLHHVADFVRAGGVGTQAADAQMVALIGAATAELLLAVDDLCALDVEVRVSTDDGSAGHHGLVTDLLEDLLATVEGGHTIAGRDPPRDILACGPHPMLSSVARLCCDAGAVCQVAMEEPMACGYGVCLGCAVPAAGGGYLLLCDDGPVFDARQMAW